MLLFSSSSEKSTVLLSDLRRVNVKILTWSEVFLSGFISYHLSLPFAAATLCLGLAVLFSASGHLDSVHSAQLLVPIPPLFTQYHVLCFKWPSPSMCFLRCKRIEAAVSEEDLPVPCVH